MNKKLIAVIDFGNNMLSIAVAYKNRDNTLELVDFITKELNKSITNGVIQNPNTALTEINESIIQIEKDNNIKIGKFFFAIEPHTLRSEIVSVSCESKGDFAHNINSLKEEVEKLYIDSNRKNIQVDMLSTKSGSTIKGDFLVVTTSDEVKNSINKAVHNFSSERKADFRIAPMVEAESCLTATQKQDGALLIDFGAALTSFALYKNGLPCLVAVLPIGGIHISEDISKKFNLEVKIAEEVKKRLGISAVEFIDANKEYSVVAKDGKTQLSLIDLTQVIEARQCEIINFILQEINRNNLKNDYQEIVVVGGGANMQFLPQLLQKQADKKVIIYQTNVLEKNNKILDNTLLLALLKQTDEDCALMLKDDGGNEAITTDKKRGNATTKKKRNPWSMFSGMSDMFDETKEKKLS